MTNLEKWEKFLNRKRWKFQETKSKYGKSLMVKTYNKTYRCHIFMSEDKLNFAFFKKGAAKSDFDIIKRTQINFCLSFRNGSLHIYTKSVKLGFRNLGKRCGEPLISEIQRLINAYNINRRTGKKSDNRTSRNKFTYILDLYLRLNGEKGDVNRIGGRLREACYPALKNMPTSCINIGPAHLLRKKDFTFDDYMKKTYKHKSKILKKAVINTITHNKLVLLHLLKNKFNRGELEKMLSVLAGKRFTTGLYGHYERDVKYFFSQYSNKKIFKMFKNEFVSYNFTDAITQLWEYKDKIIAPQDFKDMRDIHDNISLQYKRIGQEDYDFNIPERIEKLDGIQLDNDIIIVPKTRHELLDWGQKMNNCIASYHKEFHTGRTIILGVKEDDKIKYNIEINGGRIIQFMENRNRRVNQETIDKYKKVFVKHKLIAKGA